MKVKRFFMEDWLIDSKKVKYNLAESGCQDLLLKELLHLCGLDTAALENVFLGDNVPWGSNSLREEICRSYTTVSPQQLMVANGTSEALFAFFNTFLEPGDEVIVPFPAFQSLYQVPVSIGCRVKFLELKEEDDWKINFHALENLMTPRTKLIIINTPHNPFGWTLSESEIEQILSIAESHHAHLLFDEHYRYLPLQAGTDLIPSGYDICHKRGYKQVSATGSMIKCFGIVGIRIGWLIGEPKILRECIDYKDYLTHTIPHLTDTLAYLALKNKEKIIAHKKKDILANLDLLDQFILNNSHCLKWIRPTGGVVCFPQWNGNISADAFCQQTYLSQGVSLLPGNTFETENYFRMNFGIDRHLFSEALKGIQSSLNLQFQFS